MGVGRPAQSMLIRGVETNLEGAQTLSCVLDRSRLFIDLDEATDPERPESVLVVFGFEALEEHHERGVDSAAETLLRQVASRVTRRITGFGTLYQPRRVELCALLDGSLIDLRRLLAEIRAEVDGLVRPYGARTTLGLAALPAEASDPLTALALADQRVRVRDGDLGGAPRGEPLSRQGR